MRVSVRCSVQMRMIGRMTATGEEALGQTQKERCCPPVLNRARL